MSNDEVIKALTIPGIGVWTANVFLIFNLQGLDVVPAADLGIRRGVQLVYGLKSLPPPIWFTKRPCAGNRTPASLLITCGMQLNSK
jgi:DNA-3-methyladenine glycosylase II